MKTALTILIALHGLIHLLGFAKAFGISEIKELSLPISKTMGALWFLAFGLFMAVAYLYFTQHIRWWVFGFTAVLVSQVLIVYFWQDAKYGTIANVIILLATITGYGAWSFESGYKKDVAKAVASMGNVTDEIISEKDLAHLPSSVQGYLKYVGVIGQPKIKNYKIEFNGEMREKGKPFFQFNSEQYNFIKNPARYFFMKAKVNGLPTHGYHAYENKSAGMSIKLLSLVPILNWRAAAGDEGFKTETVTYFNDMCLFAPAALIDKRIKWEMVDTNSARAIFTNQGVEISAVLYFNEKNQLVNFISDDRGALTEDGMKNYRFSTPASNYQKINGYNLCSYGEAIWHYPDGEFVYGKFEVKNVEYNLGSAD